MQDRFEIQFEIEPVMPDTSASVKAYFDAALQEALAESASQAFLADDPQVTYEQHLPLTKEQVEIIAVALTFVIQQSPDIWQHTKTFLTFLTAKLAKKGPITVKGKIKLGDKKEIEFKGLSLEDTVHVITKEYEIILLPRE